VAGFVRKKSSHRPNSPIPDLHIHAAQSIIGVGANRGRFGAQGQKYAAGRVVSPAALWRNQKLAAVACYRLIRDKINALSGSSKPTYFLPIIPQSSEVGGDGSIVLTKDRHTMFAITITITIAVPVSRNGTCRVGCFSILFAQFFDIPNNSF
jgi:hypothetical protein